MFSTHLLFRLEIKVASLNASTYAIDKTGRLPKLRLVICTDALDTYICTLYLNAMNSDQQDTRDLQEKVALHLKGFNIFDVPEGRHRLVIDEFFASHGNPPSDELIVKLKYIDADYRRFNAFLATQETFKSTRLGSESQANLEPKRAETAIATLTGMGFDVRVVNNTEINFDYKGEVVKYFPYSGWASGKSIIDGRGLKHLIGQLKDG